MRENSIIKANILKYLDFKGISKYKFYQETGISNGILSQKNGLSEENTLKILSHYPDVNPSWLLSGDGNMLTTENDDRNLSIVNDPKVSYSKGVPYYDVDFIGGFDLVINDQSIEPQYYIDFAPFNDADCWVNVTGKSMSPFISHGDLVALKEMQNWKDFMLYGEIYAIITDDFRTIKIVSKGTKQDHIKLIPYNKGNEFVEQDLPSRLVNKVFAVKGSIKKFF